MGLGTGNEAGDREGDRERNGNTLVRAAALALRLLFRTGMGAVALPFLPFLYLIKHMIENSSSLVNLWGATNGGGIR